jgi:hypothetical protein
MIKDLEVLRPSFYHSLINFDYLPDNSDTQLIHMCDGESIDLWYKQAKVCYHKNDLCLFQQVLFKQTGF